MHPKRHPLFLVFLCVFVLPGCRKVNTAAPDAYYTEQFNLSYGTNLLQTCDLFLPEGRNRDTRTVILLHGGGWVSGEKEYMNGYARALALSGIAAVSINYRLACDTVHCDDILDDVDSAICFVGAHSAEWAIGSKRPALLGYSAGGHLALLFACSRDHRRRVGAVVSLAGPADLQDSLLWKSPGLLADIRLLTGDTLPEHWDIFSPVYFANNPHPPLLLIHGNSDSVVPINQTCTFSEKASRHCGPVAILLLDHETHYYSAAACAKILERAAGFIKEELN
jgi:acetyl esterase/lipase